MKHIIRLAMMFMASVAFANRGFALSEELTQPKVFFPKGFDPNRAEQIHAVPVTQAIDTSRRSGLAPPLIASRRSLH